MAYIDINDSDVDIITVLTDIDSKIPTQGQKPMAGSLPVVIASDQSTLNVKDITGKLVPDVYDEIALTYVPSGNGVGQVQTAVYKLATVTIATLTLSYDSSNRLIDVLRS